MRIRAATRGSALARWQTDHIAGLLTAVDPSVEFEVVVVDTEGDRRRDVPISTLGGKGVFAKDVQSAVLDGRADIAVHSAKDLPSVTVDGLTLARCPSEVTHVTHSSERDWSTCAPELGSATGSNRRRVQLPIKPDLEFGGLRGNMHTRLTKATDFDAIVVAPRPCSGSVWQGRSPRSSAPDLMEPQVAQAAARGVGCGADDGDDAAICWPGSRMRRAAGRSRRTDTCRPSSAAIATFPAAALCDRDRAEGSALDSLGRLTGRPPAWFARATRSLRTGRPGSAPTVDSPRRMRTALGSGKRFRLGAYLVGAGPGDPGSCWTFRGADVLGRADVVIYDRLSAAELLDLATAFR